MVVSVLRSPLLRAMSPRGHTRECPDDRRGRPIGRLSCQFGSRSCGLVRPSRHAIGGEAAVPRSKLLFAGLGTKHGLRRAIAQLGEAVAALVADHSRRRDRSAGKRQGTVAAIGAGCGSSSAVRSTRFGIRLWRLGGQVAVIRVVRRRHGDVVARGNRRRASGHWIQETGRRDRFLSRIAGAAEHFNLRFKKVRICRRVVWGARGP